MYSYVYYFSVSLEASSTSYQIFFVRVFLEPASEFTTFIYNFHLGLVSSH